MEFILFLPSKHAFTIYPYFMPTYHSKQSIGKGQIEIVKCDIYIQHYMRELSASVVEGYANMWLLLLLVDLSLNPAAVVKTCRLSYVIAKLLLPVYFERVSETFINTCIICIRLVRAVKLWLVGWLKVNELLFETLFKL